jgi:hypothetical protein
MIGLTPEEGEPMMRKILENRSIQIVDDKIHTLDIREIVKRALYWRRAIHKPAP